MPPYRRPQRKSSASGFMHEATPFEKCSAKLDRADRLWKEYRDFVQVYYDAYENIFKDSGNGT